MARWPTSVRARSAPRSAYSSVPVADAHDIELPSRNTGVADFVESSADSAKFSLERTVGAQDPVHQVRFVALNSRSDSENTAAEPHLPLDVHQLSAHDMATLRKVSDKLPWPAFLVALVELCERFAYYGLSGPFQNYMQNSYGNPAVPGALGLGQKTATGLSNFFQFWCYITPIGGAVVADQYLGRYNTILYFSLIYISGIVVLFATSLPYSIEHGLALPGLIISMLVIGLGTGGIKSNVSPLIAEQYQAAKPYAKTLRSGERVLVDPSVTIQRIYMIFYLCINIGSLSSVATTELESHVGFWSAYLLPLCMFMFGLLVVVAGKKYYVSRPPKGSAILHAFRAVWIAATHRFQMNAAKPSHKAGLGGKYHTPWDDQFIDELKRALVACKVFAFYPIYWLIYGQMVNNFISQAGQMELHGIPNDILQNIDPITIIIFIPICDRFLYPFLRKRGMAFLPITRITWGFLLAALAMLYAAFVQRLIYSAGPCYDFPLQCEASQGGSIPNRVHVVVQAPAYLLIALSEIFASVTGLEYAYTKAPASMKSFIMSIFLLQNAIGAALGIALSSTAENPKLVWLYLGLSATTFVVAVLFWLLYRHLNAAEEAMNALDEQRPKMAEDEDMELVGHDDQAEALLDGQAWQSNEERVHNG